MSVRVFGRVEEFLRASLVDPVERDHRQSSGDFRRRQVVTAVFTVLGTGVLGWGLNVEPGSSWFYVATFALAAVWTVGAFASGPLHIGRIDGRPAPRRPILAPLVLGLGLAAVFVLGALVVREIGALEGAVDDVLAFARQGSGPLVMVVAVVNGVAEELFFRGALYAAVPGRHQVAVTVVVYTLVTVATGNVMLAFAALVLGTVVGLQRAASGGVLAPIITHVAWSSALLLVLPVLF
ncbi:MAG: CPBP family glutamic-type intramembrane protease [Actinomycetota bacterium]|nr:CPBP family glutamic-type intramembrane protease [Actinomycetota bacterium]